MADRIDTSYSKNTILTQKLDESLPRKQAARSGSNATDRVSLSTTEEVGETYGPGLKVASAYELLRGLVINTLQEQGVALQVSVGDVEIDLTSLTQEEAQDLVAEDGYFGIEQTSERIADFAINAFGGDPSRLQEMKDAIDDGFAQAQDAFGGALPEISQQTYEEIMNKLDDFAAQFSDSEE